MYDCVRVWVLVSVCETHHLQCLCSQLFPVFCETWERGGGGLALWHFPVQNQERPQPLKTPVIGRGAIMSLFHLRKSDCKNKAKLEDLSVIQTLC